MGFGNEKIAPCAFEGKLVLNSNVTCIKIDNLNQVLPEIESSSTNFDGSYELQFMKRNKRISKNEQVSESKKNK